MNEIEENLNFGKHECENHHETKKSDYICVIRVAFCQKMTPSTVSDPCFGPNINKIEENSKFLQY